MSLYFSLNFTGSYSSLQNFFHSKGWQCEMKQVAPNKALVKTSDDEYREEMRFFVSTQDSTYNVKYENVKVFLYSSMKYLKANTSTLLKMVSRSFTMLKKNPRRKYKSP